MIEKMTMKTKNLNQSKNNQIKEREKNKKDSQNGVLFMQLLICLLAFLLLLIGKKSDCEYYQICKELYEDMMEKNIVLRDMTEESRFVSMITTAAQNLSVCFTETLPEKNMKNLPAGGGDKIARWPNPPQGYKNEYYAPKENLQSPIKNYYVSSKYGWRKHPITGKSDFHTGIDLAAPEGEYVLPAEEGVIIKNAYSHSYGNYVDVLHANGLMTRYCHMQYVFVKQGQLIEYKTVLGTVGSTGSATGPHLHFELIYNGKGFNPAKALNLL